MVTFFKKGPLRKWGGIGSNGEKFKGLPEVLCAKGNQGLTMAEWKLRRQHNDSDSDGDSVDSPDDRSGVKLIYVHISTFMCFTYPLIYRKPYQYVYWCKHTPVYVEIRREWLKETDRRREKQGLLKIIFKSSLTLFDCTEPLRLAGRRCLVFGLSSCQNFENRGQQSVYKMLYM